MKTPDICLMISKEILIFDKINNLIHILVYADDSSGSYDLSLQKINKLKEWLLAFKPPVHETSIINKNININIDYLFGKDDFISAVKKIKEYIVNGDAMQVVLSQRMSIDFTGEPISFYRELRQLNPSPYMYYLNMGDYHIVGSSPEILVRLEDNLITVRPIAGTRPRGSNDDQDSILEDELLNDPKEKAEHLMLIDLGRNDAGKVSKIGSIKLTDKMIIEKYSHVMHMVSNVTGEINDGLGMIDVLKSTFPAGTVSGAPKIRAIEIIYEQETIKRGVAMYGCLAENGYQAEPLRIGSVNSYQNVNTYDQNLYDEKLNNTYTDQSIETTAANLDINSFIANANNECKNLLSRNQNIRNDEITIEFKIYLDEMNRPTKIELSENNSDLNYTEKKLSKLAFDALENSKFISTSKLNETSIYFKKIKFPENFCT